MYDEILYKLENGNPMKFKDLKTTKTKLKPLFEMGFIKGTIIQNKKGTLKTENACFITDKGKKYIYAMKNDAIELSIEVEQLKKDIANVKQYLDNINGHYVNLSDQIDILISNVNNLENKVLDVRSKSGSDKKLNLDDVYSAYIKYKKKLSPIAPIRKVINEIYNNTKISVPSIEKQLYEYYVKNKLQLIKGQGENPLISPDGDSYSFVQFGD